MFYAVLFHYCRIKNQSLWKLTADRDRELELTSSLGSSLGELSGEEEFLSKEKDCSHR